METKQIIDRETQVLLLRFLADRMVSREGASGHGRSLLLTVTEIDALADRIARGEDSLVPK